MPSVLIKSTAMSCCPAVLQGNALQAGSLVPMPGEQGQDQKPGLEKEIVALGRHLQLVPILRGALDRKMGRTPADERQKSYSAERRERLPTESKDARSSICGEDQGNDRRQGYIRSTMCNQHRRNLRGVHPAVSLSQRDPHSPSDAGQGSPPDAKRSHPGALKQL